MFSAALTSKNITATGCLLGSVTGLQMTASKNVTATAPVATPPPQADATVAFTIDSKNRDVLMFQATEPKIALALVQKSGATPIDQTLSIEGLPGPPAIPAPTAPPGQPAPTAPPGQPAPTAPPGQPAPTA